MQAANYIFLERNWAEDQEHINKILRYQIDLGLIPHYLFFPEGKNAQRMV